MPFKCWPIHLQCTSSSLLITYFYFKEQNTAVEFNFQFSAETEAERAEWTKEIQKILETPLLPQVFTVFKGLR